MSLRVVTVGLAAIFMLFVPVGSGTASAQSSADPRNTGNFAPGLTRVTAYGNWSYPALARTQACRDARATKPGTVATTQLCGNTVQALAADIQTEASKAQRSRPRASMLSLAIMVAGVETGLDVIDGLNAKTMTGRVRDACNYFLSSESSEQALRYLPTDTYPIRDAYLAKTREWGAACRQKGYGPKDRRTAKATRSVPITRAHCTATYNHIFERLRNSRGGIPSDITEEMTAWALELEFKTMDDPNAACTKLPRGFVANADGSVSRG